MMKFMQFKSHWTPEEAHTLLTFLDDFRDTLWQNYGHEIIEYCRQQQINEHDFSVEFEDDVIPF